MTGGDDEARRRDAAATLARIGREGDLFATSAPMSADRPPDGTDHGDGDDDAERWGRRIGRTLAVLAAGGMVAYLYLAHVR